MRSKIFAVLLLCVSVVVITALFDVAAEIDKAWAQGKNDFASQDIFLLGLFALVVAAFAGLAAACRRS